jgi:hypothetical protein
MFSSDYPHVEGGRRPIERFEASLAGIDDDARRAFYHDNFADLMGRAALTAGSSSASLPPRAACASSLALPSAPRLTTERQANDSDT